MPRRRAVLMTRQAISPRLAMRIFLNMVSALDPPGSAFVEKGADALFCFGCRTQSRNALRRVFHQGVIERTVNDGADQFLRCRLRLGSAAEQGSCDLDQRFIECVVALGAIHPNGGNTL